MADDHATVPFHALFAEDNLNPNRNLAETPRNIIAGAAVIVCIDVMSRNESLVFGRDALKIIAAGQQAVQMPVLRVELDQETDELERLLALVQVVKGYHEYEAG